MTDTAREALQARTELELTAKAYDEIHQDAMRAVFEEAQTPDEAWGFILEYRAASRAVSILMSKIATKQIEDTLEEQSDG